tara:strand:- start:3964 stop:4371 length:408 start_codon:yes stop_codon:yes gene_type:complete
VPLVVRPWTIPPDAICKVSTKAIDLEPDRFPADYHATRSQKIFSIRFAQGKPMVRPHSVRNDLTRVADAFQARHIDWNIQGADISFSNPVNNLAIPTHDLRLSYGNTHSRCAQKIHGSPQTFHSHAICSIRKWCV